MELMPIIAMLVLGLVIAAPFAYATFLFLWVLHKHSKKAWHIFWTVHILILGLLIIGFYI